LNENAVISMRPGGWQVVRYTLEEFDQGRIYPSEGSLGGVEGVD
jgi:hypothetical protein